MRILTYLQNSYLVADQESAEYIEELENALLLIEKLVKGDLFSTETNILKVVEEALSRGDK
jgi:hypothetical protein